MPICGVGMEVELTPKLLKIKLDPSTEHVSGARAVTSGTVTWLAPGPAQSMLTGPADAKDPIATKPESNRRSPKMIFTAMLPECFGETILLKLSRQNGTRIDGFVSKLTIDLGPSSSAR